MGWGGGRSWVSRMRTPAPPPRPAEDGLLRCKQLTVLLDWAEQFEAESRQSDEAVAFSVLLGDLNFDNCSLGKTARPPPTPRASPALPLVVSFGKGAPFAPLVSERLG